MKWSFRIGRLLGIDVYIHFTFVLLLAFLGLSQWLAGHGLMEVTGAMLFFLSLFACVLLHEFGHALMARHYGISTRDITLLPIGGVARLERVPEKPVHELWVALAGPAVNVVIAAALALGLVASHSWTALLAPLSGAEGGWGVRLLTANIFLALFNLLPAFPMDGGRILRALLALRLEYAQATRIAAVVGQGMAVLLGVAGLFGNPLLLLIALFVWMGAAQEASAVEVKSVLAHFSVRDAMLTNFETLAPQNTLGEAAHLLLAGSQPDFPVVERGTVIGLLRRLDLVQALAKNDETTMVRAAMRSDFAMLEVDDLLESALPRIQGDNGSTLPVMEGGRLAGLVTAENVTELMMIHTARKARPRSGSPPTSKGLRPPLIAAPFLVRKPSY